MGQQFQQWRSGDGQRLWLSMLVETMEEISRPDISGVPCSPSVLAALRSQLALPASPCVHGASGFSLRN